MKTGRLPRFGGLARQLVTAALIFVAMVCARAESRIALVVTAPENAADWQTALTAGLSAARPVTELVERGELARVWAERERAALSAKPEAGLAVPAVATVERYLHFRLVGDGRWIVELVNAASGRALGAVAVDAADLSEVSRLVKAAGGLLDAPVPAEKSRATKVAVVESVEAVGNAELFGLAVRLRAALADSGLVVLDRALTQELAVERNDAKRGFREAAADGDLLGIDYWIELTPRDGRLVRVRDGVVVAIKNRGADEDETVALRDWALPRLGIAAAALEPYRPQVEVEAMEPFFQGIALHDAGRYAEASAEFARAYRINGRFREAYEWTARCYDALDIPEMASGMRRYLDTEFLENLPAASGRVVAVDGLAFTGIQTPDESLAPLGGDVSAITASVLAARADLGLRMPDQLARLRREYDWMHGGGGEGGYGEGASMGMFTRMVLTGRLERAAGRVDIQWVLRDSLGLRPPTTRTQSLPADHGQWPQALGSWLVDWPKVDREAPRSKPTPRAEQSVVREIGPLVAKLADAQGLAAEAVRLELMTAAPEHPLSVARGEGKTDQPLAGFLDYGKREYVIRRLAESHVQRRWLELMRALDHFGAYTPAQMFAGRRLDTAEELRRLIAAGRQDGPGLAARYYQLYFGQGTMPPAALAAECRALRADLAVRPDRVAEIHDALGACIDALARLADIAAGVPQDTYEGEGLDKFQAPTHPPVLRWDAAGRLTCGVEAYAINRRFLNGLGVEDLVRNARAQLVINGRGDERDVYDPAWLQQHPDTLALAFFAAHSLNRSTRGIAIAEVSARGWEMEKARLRAGVEYVAATVEDGFARYTTLAALKNTSVLGAALLGVSGSSRMQEMVTAAEFAALQERFAAAEAKAFGGLGAALPGFNNNAYRLSELSYGNVRKHYADELDRAHNWIARGDGLSAALPLRAKAFATATKPEEPRNWWWLARRWETDNALTAVERANLLAPQADDALRVAGTATDEATLGRLFDLGLMLSYGRKDVEAEKIFAYLGGLPATAEVAFFRRENAANALFRLAQIERIAGRLPEALATASRGLTLAMREDMTFYTHATTYVHNKGGLASQFSRLLTELRFNPERANLSARVEFVRVPTANGDNPLLTVYYRRPPVQASDVPGKKHRVLVIIPVTNEDAHDYVADDSPWARFADDRGLVLVVPRFCVSDRIFRAEHRFTLAYFAEAWSGEALLHALEAIDRRIPIEQARLLLHGQTSGGGFATHFAAWRPERVAAVSVVNGNWGLCRAPGEALKPAEAQKHIRFWVGANPRDNTAIPSGRPRFIHVLEFTARLMSFGVEVEWSEWPAETHTPSPEMEAAARAFFARQLSP